MVLILLMKMLQTQKLVSAAIQEINVTASPATVRAFTHTQSSATKYLFVPFRFLQILPVHRLHHLSYFLTADNLQNPFHMKNTAVTS